MLPFGTIPLRRCAYAGASSLIDLMAQDFDPEQYKDHYRNAVEDGIESKLEGKEITKASPVPSGKVVDLMEALKASLDRAKSSRKETKQVAERAKPSKGVSRKPIKPSSKKATAEKASTRSSSAKPAKKNGRKTTERGAA